MNRPGAGTSGTKGADLNRKGMFKCANREGSKECFKLTNKGLSIWRIGTLDGKDWVPICSDCARDLAEKILATNSMRRIDGIPDSELENGQ